MKNQNLTKFIPFICAIAVFIGIVVYFFNPILLDDKALRQGDITQFNGSAHEIMQYREKHGTEPLWTNSMFGGMPAYQISTNYKGAFIIKLEPFYRLFIPTPAAFLLIGMFSFFILLLVLDINPWVAIGGSVAFSLASYNIVILVAGHNTQIHTLALTPLVLAGVMLLYKQNYWWGLALTALSLTIEVTSNHFQITYYLFLILAFMVIVEGVHAVLNKTLKQFIIASLLLGLSGALAVGANASALMTTSEYANQTIRGKSELKSNKVSTGGLDIDYAFQWSYSPWETMNLFIPNFYGGSSDEAVDPEGDFAKALASLNIPQNNIDQICQQAPTYWGDQPFTAGPVYIGAIVLFLFVLGMFLVKDKMKWWVLAAFILAILLSWGSHFLAFTGFMFKYLPGFNKFRTVYMILVIAEIVVPLWAMVTIDNIIKGRYSKEDMMRALKISAGIVGGVALIMALMGPSMMHLTSGKIDINNLARMFGANPEDPKVAEPIKTVLKGLEKERGNMLSLDAWRSLILVLLTGGVLWLFITDKIKKNILFAVLGLLIVFDMGQIAKRYLKDSDFVEKSDNENALVQMSPADKAILNDNAPDYRVLNMAVSYFNDATTSYYHKSVGGYHAAKLRRYNELNNAVIETELGVISQVINSHNPEAINTLFDHTPALDMLNTKYVILDPKQGPLPNKRACGNAWFVNGYKIAEDADAELAGVKTLNVHDSCIIDKQFDKQLNGLVLNRDSSAKITLDNYEPNKLVYSTHNTNEGLAVFSEIYYNLGWNVTMDDKPADYLRCNYVLRGMLIPAGDHKIVFTFEPKSYATGEKISLLCSLLVLLLIGVAGYFSWRQSKKAHVTA